MARRHVLVLWLVSLSFLPCVTARPTSASFITILRARAHGVHLDTPLSPSTRLEKRKATSLFYTRYDSLISGIAEISMGTSLGVLWSEYAILTTGCGPINLSDGLERFCYQVVIVVAGMILFSRIVTRKDLVALSQEHYGELLQDSTLIQVRVAELSSLLAVLGAFLALGSQMYHGYQMDGLTGIDVQMCRAIRDL